MKRFLIFLLLAAFLATGVVGQTTKVGGAGTTKVSASGSGGLTKVSPVAASVTYLYQTDFPGSAVPAGWLTNPTVNVAGGIVTCANDGAEAYADNLITAQTELWIYVKILINSSTGDPPRVFGFFDSGFSNVQIYLDLSGGFFNVYDTSGLVGTTSATWTTGVTYGVWIHYKAGSGANGIATVGFSTTTTEPTSGANFAGSTTSSGVGSAVRSITLQALFGGTESVSFSKLRIATVPIGNNPT